MVYFYSGVDTRDLAAEVLRKAGDGDLGDWTRSIVDRALERAGETARQPAGQTVPGSSGETPDPLPAERHAPSLAAGRANAAEILLFTSLSVPAASWRQWARDAARIGAPLVMRGVAEGSLRTTVKRIGDRLGGHDAGVAIDPRLFRLFGVTRVPAVVVVPGGVPPCASRGCLDDPAPAHDRVTGNIGLAAALEAIAAEGSAARDVARRHLQSLRGRRSMTGAAERDLPVGRTDVWIDRATRVVRLLAWTAMFAVCCLMLWAMAGMAAHAGDPKAAARAIGQAGTAAAGAIARDASKAGTVPGYAGTNVPERGLTAGGMEDAARARLADPDDPGGKAGRAVIEGTTMRPAASVTVADPAVARGKRIAADPQASAHRAGGLASGNVSACGSDLEAARDGGSCGSVRYCVGAGCETVRPQSNTGFVDATSRLNMALELGGEEFDREDMRFFKGKRRRCHIHFGGLANCCKNSGLLVGLANCSANEVSLAEERNAGNTHYLGKHCSKRTFFGICIRRSRAWCVIGSKLGRILQQQGRRQLGVGWGNCRGLTVAEIERLDFASLDFSEFTENLMDGSMEPSVSLPDAGDTGAAMRTRIRDFYSRGQ